MGASTLWTSYCGTWACLETYCCLQTSLTTLCLDHVSLDSSWMVWQGNSYPGTKKLQSWGLSALTQTLIIASEKIFCFFQHCITVPSPRSYLDNNMAVCQESNCISPCCSFEVIGSWVSVIHPHNTREGNLMPLSPAYWWRSGGVERWRISSGSGSESAADMVLERPPHSGSLGLRLSRLFQAPALMRVLPPSSIISLGA